MRKTQWIELIKNIKETRVSYFSILLFVVLGIALFLGLGWSGTAMKQSGDAEYAKYKLHDLEVIFPYGFDNEDLKKISKTEGVSAVEGTRYDFRFFVHNGKKEQAKVIGITNNIDKLSYAEGKLPQKDNEIAVEKKWADDNGIAIGDRIKFHDGKGTFKVTALVESVVYTATNPSSYGFSTDTSTPVTCIMFVTKDALEDVTFERYNEILVYCDDLAKIPFYTPEYSNKCDLLKDDVYNVATKLAADKCDEYQDMMAMIPGGEDLPDVDCTVLKKTENSSVAYLKLNADASSDLKYSLASLLVIIGLLVCYSAVTRIVHNQTTSLGTKKALGFSNKEITLSYLTYTGSAAVIGSVIGILLGRFVLEVFIVSEMKRNFIFETAQYSFSATDALVMALLEIALILLATIVACMSTLRRDAVSLLSGEKPPEMKHRFYEKLGLWNRLPLLSKTIVNNCFTDKRRVFATIIGIIGCTALVACGLTFKDNVSGSPDLHYSKVQNYDTIVYFDPDVEKSDSEMEKIFAKENAESCKVYTSRGYFSMDNGDSIATDIFVTDDDRFSKMVNLYSVGGHEKESIHDGIWISRSMAEEYSLSPGDEIDFTDSEGKEKQLTIGGVNEYYLAELSMFMDMDTYEEEFDKKAEYNGFMLITKDADKDRLIEKLIDVDGFITSYDFKEITTLDMESVNGGFIAMSILYLAMSFAMAVLVILNLLITFVQEKKRDLIIMMINGYSTKNARKYIYGDTIFLTVNGIILGLVLGVIIGGISIDSISSGSIYFSHAIDINACIISVLTTAALTLAMSIIALKGINRFKLTDINGKG